jgi:hypothetical protein
MQYGMVDKKLNWEHLFYLTTHDYVVILCVPPTFAIPAFVVVAWAREVSSFNRRKASVFVQAVVWWSVSSMDVVGDDLGMGPRPSKEMAASPEEPLVKQASLPNC